MTGCARSNVSGALDPRDARDELVASSFYRLLSEQSPIRASIGEADRRRTLNEGLTQAEVREVEVLLLRHLGDKAGEPPCIDGPTRGSQDCRGFGRPAAFYVHLPASHGVEPLPVRRLQAEQLNYAARAAALRESASLRECKPVDYAAMARSLAEQTRPEDHAQLLQEARGGTSPPNAGDA